MPGIPTFVKGIKAPNFFRGIRDIHILSGGSGRPPFCEGDQRSLLMAGTRYSGQKVGKGVGKGVGKRVGKEVGKGMGKWGRIFRANFDRNTKNIKKLMQHFSVYFVLSSIRKNLSDF
jgi:hypothetical protein